MPEISDESKPKNPHDSAFKAAMDDIRVAREFFDTYLPEHVKKLINPDTLAIQNSSFIDKDLHPTASDVLYGVKLNDNKRSDAYLYVLVEAQTKPDKFLPFRMLDYIVRIIYRHIDQKEKQEQKLDKLPLVFPLIMYNGRVRYTYPIDIPSLFEYPELAEHMLTKDFKFIELRTMDDEVLLKHHWTGLLEMFLKHAKIRDAQLLLESVLNSLMKPLLKEEAHKYVSSMISYLINVGEVSDINEFLDCLRGQVIEPYPQLEGDIMRIAEQLKQQGVQQGMQQGMQLGQHQFVYRQLERKFGSLSERYKSRLDKLSSDELLEFDDRLHEAQSLDELFPEH